MKVRIIPVDRVKRYECFECGRSFVVPLEMTECYDCGETDNFYKMD